MSILTILLSSAMLLSNSHDITSLPSWGPYSKYYAGITHIENTCYGSAVQFLVAPGSYRRSNICVPNSLFESGCYPWEISPDYKNITYRQTIEDGVFVDVTYHVMDEKSVLLEMRCVNEAKTPQDFRLNTIANEYLAEDYPRLKASEGYYIPGIDYIEYESTVKPHDYSLVWDGKMRGEKRTKNSTSGSILETSGKAGDIVKYFIPNHTDPVKIHWKADYSNSDVYVEVNGKQMLVNKVKGWNLTEVPCPGNELAIKTLCDGKLDIDCIIIGKDAKVSYSGKIKAPELIQREQDFIIKYPHGQNWYGVAWNFKYSAIIEYKSDNLENLMKMKANNHIQFSFKDNGNKHYTAAAIRPIHVKPQSDTTIWNLLVTGTKEEVEAALAAFHSDEKALTSKTTTYHYKDSNLLPAAEPYVKGQQLLQATLLYNVVYPIYTQKEYIRHYTPGKYWNCLYTWDSGMISFALGDVDPILGFENLRAYTTEPGCQSAYIHHGTPLPIQFFAFEQLASKTGDLEKIKFLYPRMMQYLGFMLGWDNTSTTRMKSGLIRTWDYFYNSGGWDDYPAQWSLTKKPELYPSVAPIVSSAYYIRAAKIMRMVAEKLGKKEDVKKLDAEIKKISAAVLNNAWDEESGYFGYVTHDSEGKPSGIYRYSDGSNFNMGLDGISPLVAGIGSEEQTSRMLENLFSDKHLWTPYGISTVDQSAAYYSKDGYWNGCIWMPHQYLQWKAMLDLGLADRAQQIAFTGLKTWNDEINRTNQCYEHFLVEDGRGAGWHNFSGLSSPVVSWFTAYFKKGTLSTGFDTMVEEQKWNSDCSSLEATLSFDKDAAGKTSCIAVCMAPSKSYSATAGGASVKTYSPYEGLVYVYVKASKKGTKITVTAE